MLALSARVDYALLLLTLLAKGKSDNFISLSTLARKTKLPGAFLSRIAVELAAGGILQSKEGVDGGYRLAKNPEKITIAEVIEVIEGSWALTKCAHKLEECRYGFICPMSSHWQGELSAKIWQVFNSYSIKDLT